MKKLRKYIAYCAVGAIIGLLIALGIFRWEFKEFLVKGVILIVPLLVMLTMVYMGYRETHKREK